jgi:hypothetical protein
VFVARPGQRSGDDLEIIYDELLHIKALAQVSNTVRAQRHTTCLLKTLTERHCTDWVHPFWQTKPYNLFSKVAENYDFN